MGFSQEILLHNSFIPPVRQKSGANHPPILSKFRFGLGIEPRHLSLVLNPALSSPFPFEKRIPVASREVGEEVI